MAFILSNKRNSRTKLDMYRLLPKSKAHHNDGTSYKNNVYSLPVPAILDVPPPEALQEAIFAAGSFWKVEATFGDVDGVIKTATGYYGGTLVKPKYREVCGRLTGHTEAVRVIYDKRKISYKCLCNIFWQSHDPTNKDYLDFGLTTHQRSAIFWKDEEQKKKAQKSKVEQQMKLNRRIVTKILPLCGTDFYLAENVHQKYYLQQHVQLCNSLQLRSTDQFVDSHLACKLNGVLGSREGASYQNLKRFMENYDLPVQLEQVLKGVLEELKNNNVVNSNI